MPGPRVTTNAGAAAAPVRVLLVSGSTRAGSTNTATLRTVAELAVAGVAATVWDRLVDLPAFVPDDPVAPAAEPPGAVAGLRLAVTGADAVLFCTPEYAGTLPGSLKNALDWLVGSGELYGRPVAWINVGGPGRGAGAERTLSSVLGYVGADVVEAACGRIPVGRELVGADGVVHDPGVRAGLAERLVTLVEHVRATADA